MACCMNCGKAKGQKNASIFVCKNIMFMVAAQRKHCRNLSGLWSEAVQEACAGRRDLGCWDLKLKGLTQHLSLLFFEI